MGFKVYDAAGTGKYSNQALTGFTQVVITVFSGIELRRNESESGIIVPSEISFTIVNPNGDIDHSGFKGGKVIVELYLGSETKIAGWEFRIKSANPKYQTIQIVAEDWLQYYLAGDYPNTKYPEEIFPSSRSYAREGLCVPVPFGTAYVPLRDVYITDASYLLLGDSAYTYNITKVRSPQGWGANRDEYSSSSYTFSQFTKADANSVNWQVFRALIVDSDDDGIYDDHGIWFSGGTYHDPAVQFTRSDTASLTNPADVIKFVLEDFGIPAAKIDAASFDSAKTTYTSWGLTFNGAFWYKQPRSKVLSQLLNMAHSCLDVGETIKLRVLSKTSQKTITPSDIINQTEEAGEGTFQYTDLSETTLADSGNVLWQKTGVSQDSFLKRIIAADGSGSVLSDETLECPFVQNDDHVYKIGILYFQRKLFRHASIGFLGKGTLLALQPDDRITIDGVNYGGLNPYLVLIDGIRINSDCSVDFDCTYYTVSFDDWDDVVPESVTIPTDTTPAVWSPVISGSDSVSDSGTPLNSIKGRLK